MLLKHLEDAHDFKSNEKPSPDYEVIKLNDEILSGLPKVGDKVLAMWSGSEWQYFHATIRKVLKKSLMYEIDWDDQDSSGRIVDHYNLALDKVPLESEVGIGSIVLFQQGKYTGQAGVRTGGVRWHQGRITKVYKRADGIKIYDGCHTKDAKDGKWVTYQGYSKTFKGLRLDALRIGPNVFDLVTNNNAIQSTKGDVIDIYFSYTPEDSPKAIKKNEVANVPQGYMEHLDEICDPVTIASYLTSLGLKVEVRKVTSKSEPVHAISLMKKAKVFIACISDQYVANDQCRMEFQFAKKTLNKPVIPLIVGDGSSEWTVSVVGMLIAGERYIHFKDKSVQNAKMKELLRSLVTHLPDINIDSDTNIEIQDSSMEGGPPDVFVSYCWSNSFEAVQAKHVPKCVGQKFSDPRLIEKLLTGMGLNCWIDIDCLESGNNDIKMYQELTRAIREAKVILPCISTEYANNVNSRMEFQFALKTLQKPVIPIIVGEGDDWKNSVIGTLVSTNHLSPVDLQNIDNRSSLDGKVQVLKTQIEDLIGKKFVDVGKQDEKDVKPNAAKQFRRQRAPQDGDHVVCHHFNCAYYMATVVNFDKASMKYEVDWDDGDTSGRVKDYNQVAIDVVPDADDIGVGSIIFFPQGSYSGTKGNNKGGVRYHEGIVTSIQKEGGQVLYSGHHTKGAEEGKWITYQSYSYEFRDLTLSQIRIAPTALDALHTHDYITPIYLYN